MRKLVGRRRGMQKEFVEVIFRYSLINILKNKFILKKNYSRQYFNELVDGQTTETIGIIANMIGNYLQYKIVINVPGVARGICKSSIIRQLTTSYGDPGDMPAILCYL